MLIIINNEHTLIPVYQISPLNFNLSTAFVDDEKGDLAKKKIYPTLWWLFRDNLLPKPTTFVGYARSKLTMQQLREKCHPYMKVKSDEVEKYEEFWKLNHYVTGSYDQKKDFELLNRKLQNFEQGHTAHRLFYLALPPSVFESVTIRIRLTCMGEK